MSSFSDSAAQKFFSFADEPNRFEYDRRREAAFRDTDLDTLFQRVLESAGDLLKSLPELVEQFPTLNSTLDLLPELIQALASQSEDQDILACCCDLDSARLELNLTYKSLEGAVYRNLSSNPIEKAIEGRILWQLQQKLQLAQNRFLAAYRAVSETQESEGASIESTQVAPASLAKAAPAKADDVSPLGFEEVKADPNCDLKATVPVKLQEDSPEVVSAKSEAKELIRMVDQLLNRIDLDFAFSKAVRMAELDLVLPEIDMLQRCHLQIQEDQKTLSNLLCKPQVKPDELKTLQQKIQGLIKTLEMQLSELKRQNGVGIAAGDFNGLGSKVAATSTQTVTELEVPVSTGTPPTDPAPTATDVAESKSGPVGSPNKAAQKVLKIAAGILDGFDQSPIVKEACALAGCSNNDIPEIVDLMTFRDQVSREKVRLEGHLKSPDPGAQERDLSDAVGYLELLIAGLKRQLQVVRQLIETRSAEIKDRPHTEQHITASNNSSPVGVGVGAGATSSNTASNSASVNSKEQAVEDQYEEAVEAFLKATEQAQRLARSASSSSLADKLIVALREKDEALDKLEPFLTQGPPSTTAFREAASSEARPMSCGSSFAGSSGEEEVDDAESARSDSTKSWTTVSSM